MLHPFSFGVLAWLSLVNVAFPIGVGRGGGARGASPPPPNNLRGGGQHTLWPPNNPPTFSFNFYVKQEKITKVPVEG